MAEHLVCFLTDETAARRCREATLETVTSFGGPGASQRAAEAVLGCLDEAD
jgi:hypothetical protein